MPEAGEPCAVAMMTMMAVMAMMALAAMMAMWAVIWYYSVMILSWVLLLSLSRRGLPFLFLSTDLADEALGQKRNAWAMGLMKPELVFHAGGVPGVHMDELRSKHDDRHPDRAHVILCFIFIGGTRRTKIVRVGHEMFLHEHMSYYELWQPAAPPRVLAHLSVYWAATALGQLSIAFAYGGAVVLTEVTDAQAMSRCIADCRVTVLGLVPDQLDLLASDPRWEVPGVECVFTWGERLPTCVAERWRGHPAALRELLIASEYWLALYAEPLARPGELRSVQAAEMLILAEDGHVAKPGEVGELCIAGPMVTFGFVYEEAGRFYSGPLGQRYFLTGDFIRKTAGGLIYKGRADMMARHQGKWAVMLSVEDSLLAVAGVADAKVLAEPHEAHFHAFVQLRNLAELAMESVRAVLPTRVRLWVIAEMPRRPVTRKVGVGRLLASLTRPAPSWASSRARRRHFRRGSLKARRQYPLSLTAFGRGPCRCRCR